MNNPDERTRQMLSGPILPLLARMATPQALSFLVQSSVSIVEIWFIGQLGTTSLAAMALVFPLLMLMQMLSGGSMGGAITGSMARSLGGGLIDSAERIIWQAIYLAAGLSLFFGLLYLAVGDMVLRALGGDGEVLTEAKRYTHVLFACCFLVWIYNMLLGVVRGTGNMSLPAKLMFLGAGVQVILSGLLILGVGPFPQLGILGAAVSIMTVNLVNSLILLFVLTRQHARVRLRLSQNRFDINLVKDILSVGALAGVSPFFTVFSILIMTGLVGRFGVEALAGYGIAARVEFLVVPMIFGLGVSMNSMVGLNIGHGNYDRAERIGWTGSITAGVVTGIAGILLAIWPELWVSVFTDDPRSIEVATLYFRIVGPFFGLLGMGLSLFFASQGAKAVGWPVVATISRFIFSVGAGSILLTQFGGTIETLFWCITAGVFSYVGITCAALYLGAWRKTEARGA